MRDEQDLLLAYRPWLRKVAAGMTLPTLAEDLAQEGWIAMWRAMQSYDGSSPLDWWLKRKAEDKMRTVVRDWTAQKRNLHRTYPAGDPMEDSYREGGASIWDELIVELGSIELAYHRGQVLAAINRLAPREREYVTLRFWGGLNYPELTEHFGYPPQGLWRTSQAKLRESLAHLDAT